MASVMAHPGLREVRITVLRWRVVVRVHGPVTQRYCQVVSSRLHTDGSGRTVIRRALRAPMARKIHEVAQRDAQLREREIR